jgi:flagellar protein FlbT
MALKVELKPHERIIVGNVVITNSENRARFFIDGHAPILREKDILTPETANSPAKKIYLAVQLMYLANDVGQHHEVYFNLVREFLEAAPSALPIVAEINNRILSDEIYKALIVAKKLIDYELELMSYATRG